MRDDLIERLKVRAEEHRGFFGSAKDYELFEEAIAALTSLRQNPWRPIESAPTGQRLFLWCSDLRRSEADPAKEPIGIVFGIVRAYEGGPEPRGELMSGAWTFTHWMPLPAAPLQSDSDDISSVARAPVAASSGVKSDSGEGH